MHLAVFVGPPRAAGDDSPRPSGALGLKLMRGGYRLVHVALGDDIEPSLKGALSGAGARDSLLVYVAGTMQLDEAQLRMRINGETGPSLLLVTLGELVRARASKDTLLVLDVAHDEPDADAMRASEYVQAAIDAFEAKRNGFEMLVAAGASVGSGEGVSWPFT